MFGNISSRDPDEISNRSIPVDKTMQPLGRIGTEEVKGLISNNFKKEK